MPNEPYRSLRPLRSVPRRQDIERDLERGMLSPYFGLGPSMGKHERSIDQMKQDIHHPFHGIHTKRLQDGGSPNEMEMDDEDAGQPYIHDMEPPESRQEYRGMDKPPFEEDSDINRWSGERSLDDMYRELMTPGRELRAARGGRFQDGGRPNLYPYQDPQTQRAETPAPGFMDIAQQWGRKLPEIVRDIPNYPPIRKFLDEAPGYPDRSKYPPMTAGQIGKKWLGTARDIGQAIPPTIKSLREKYHFNRGGRTPFSMYQQGGDVRKTDDPQYEETYIEAMPGFGKWQRRRKEAASLSLQGPGTSIADGMSDQDQAPIISPRLSLPEPYPRDPEQQKPQTFTPQQKLQYEQNPEGWDAIQPENFPGGANEYWKLYGVTPPGEINPRDVRSRNPEGGKDTSIYQRAPAGGLPGGMFGLGEPIKPTNEYRAVGNSEDVSSGMASRERPPLDTVTNYMADIFMNAGMKPYEAHHVARGLGNSIFKTFIPGVTTIPSGMMLGAEMGRALRPGIDAAVDDSGQQEVKRNFHNTRFKEAFDAGLAEQAQKAGVEVSKLSPYIRHFVYENVRKTDPAYQSRSESDGGIDLWAGAKGIDWKEAARVAAEGVLGVWGRSQVPFRFPELQGKMFSRLKNVGRQSENLAAPERGMVQYDKLRTNDFLPGPHQVEVRPAQVPGAVRFRDTEIDPGHFKAGKPLSHDIFAPDKNGVSRRIATIDTSYSRSWGPFQNQTPVKVNRIIVDGGGKLSPEQLNSALEQIGPIYQSRSIRGGGAPLVNRSEYEGWQSELDKLSGGLPKIKDQRKLEVAKNRIADLRDKLSPSGSHSASSAQFVNMEPRAIQRYQYSWGPYDGESGQVMPPSDQLSKALHEVRKVPVPRGVNPRVQETSPFSADPHVRQSPPGQYYSRTITPEDIAASHGRAKQTVRGLYNSREQEREIPAFMQRLYGQKDGGATPFWEGGGVSGDAEPAAFPLWNEVQPQMAQPTSPSMNDLKAMQRQEGMIATERRRFAGEDDANQSYRLGYQQRLDGPMRPRVPSSRFEQWR